MKLVYTFKCDRGHVTERVFPPGTRVDDNDETTCDECLKSSVVATAYVVWIHSQTKGQPNGGLHS